MAHTLKDGFVLVDWTTGDPEGDRLTVLSAYKDFMKEVLESTKLMTKEDSVILKNIFQKWSIDLNKSIDEIPRVFIKRPE